MADQLPTDKQLIDLLNRLLHLVIAPQMHSGPERAELSTETVAVIKELEAR